MTRNDTAGDHEPGGPTAPTTYTPPMTRDELIDRTKRLIVDGDGLLASPSLAALRTWLQRSDELLGAAWGSMDRYHLAWLMVGKPKWTVRGRPMTPDEEAAYVREVAAQKTSALRMSLTRSSARGCRSVASRAGSGSATGPAISRATPAFRAAVSTSRPRPTTSRSASAWPASRRRSMRTMTCRAR